MEAAPSSQSPSLPLQTPPHPLSAAVVLDGDQPEVEGASHLEKGVDLRILGCSSERAAIHSQFVFRSPEGYEAVITFGRTRPKQERRLRCFEMVGEYTGGKRYQLGYHAAMGSAKDSIGWLKEFYVTEWAIIPASSRTKWREIYPAPPALPTPIPPPTPLPTATPTDEKEKARQNETCLGP